MARSADAASLIGTTSFAPGWHEDRSMSDYLGDPAVSASRLFSLHETTPAHLREELRKAPGSDTTDAKALGSILHARVYEPKVFESYVVLGQCEGVKKSGDRCTYQGSVHRDGQSFCGTHDPYGKDEPMAPGIVPVAKSDRDAAIAMEASLRAHHTAAQIVWAEGPREVVGVVQDQETGLWLRIRPDQLIEEPSGTPERWWWSAPNLKSTGRVARGEVWRREVERLGLPFKAAFYRMVMRQLWDVEVQNFLYPTVETYPPYAVIVHRLHEDWLDIVEDDVRHALRTLAECVASDRWPAYGIEVHDLNLPEWRRKKLLELDSLEIEEVAA